MKKFVAMALAAAMSLTLFAGCGSKEEAASSAASAAGEASAVSEASAASEAAASEASAAEEASQDSDWAYVQEKGSILVGITLFAPMDYTEDGTADMDKLIGFDADLGRAVADKIGVPVEFVEINWDNKEVELNSKNIDCIWNGMCITEERKQNMQISDAYLYNTQALVMKADREAEIMAAGMEGLNVTAELGSTGEGKLDGSIADDDTVEVSPAEYFTGCNYDASDSMANALLAVKSGTADVAIVDSVCALAMVGEGTNYEDLVVNLDNNFGLQEYGIAFRKGSDLCEVVTGAIAELYEDGTVAKIAETYGLSDALVQK